MANSGKGSAKVAMSPQNRPKWGQPTFRTLIRKETRAMALEPLLLDDVLIHELTAELERHDIVSALEADAGQLLALARKREGLVRALSVAKAGIGPVWVPPDKVWRC
jgi:hypothetical protein